MTGRSEERIVDGSLGRAKDLEVNFPEFVQAVVSKHTAPMSHQRCQHLSLILREVGQRDKDECNEVGCNRSGPRMLISDPIIASFHRRFGSEASTLFGSVIGR